MKTERLQHFENNNLLNTPLVCSATYVRNGNLNNNAQKAVVLENIFICNTSETIDHLWVKDTKKVKASSVWRAKQCRQVYFVATFISITKAGSLYETKEDLNLKIVRIIK